MKKDLQRILNRYKKGHSSQPVKSIHNKALIKLKLVSLKLGKLIINKLINKDDFKICYFFAERIGHYAQDFYITYAHSKTTYREFKILAVPPRNSCNTHFDYLVQKHFVQDKCALTMLRISKVIPWLRSYILHPSIESMSGSRDIEGLTQQVSMPSFSNDQNSQVINWLRENGWKGKKQPIVCLHVRDSAFLKRTDPEVDRSYHDYRDSAIEDYEISVRWLIDEKDAFVIRTGRIANKRFPFNSPNLVDYPYEEIQSDLIDVWLFANCQLTITTGSGPDVISEAYSVPTIGVNYMTLGNAHTWAKVLIRSKNLYELQTHKKLTMEEYLEHDYLYSEQYTDNNIEIKNLLPHEILNTIKKGWSYLIDKDEISDSDRDKTSEYLEIINTKPEYTHRHKYINPSFVIDSDGFLQESDDHSGSLCKDMPDGKT